MLDWLTPAERRGAMVLVGLLLIGTGWDAWRSDPARRSPGFAAPIGNDPGAAGNLAPAQESAPVAGPAASGMERSLDLNRAGAAELDALPGIGPVLAARIVEQRRRAGAYRRLEDLLAVRGVGPRLLERLRPRVRIGSPRPPAAFHPGVQSAPRRHGGLADSTSVPRSSTR